MDTLELRDDKPIWMLSDIKDTLQNLYDHYRNVNSENEYLRAEIEKVKAEKYAGEELAKMKVKYEEMRADYFRGFPISEEEQKKIDEWKDKLPKANSGAIGGRFTYEFVPTSIGVIGVIKDSVTGKEFNFQGLF